MTFGNMNMTFGNMDMTFGILVNPPNYKQLCFIVNSIINQQIPNYEILIIGSINLDTLYDNNHDIDNNNEFKKIINIPFDEDIKHAWITKKKNIINDNAKYDTVVFLHDYILFPLNWYNGMLEFNKREKGKWSICMTKIIDTNGKRWNDWITHRASDEFGCWSVLAPYNYKNTHKMYVNGTYWISKKHVLEKYPLDISRAWGELEDVEWSTSWNKDLIYKMNTLSMVQLIRPKNPAYIFPNEIKNTLLNNSLNSKVQGYTLDYQINHPDLEGGLDPDNITKRKTWWNNQYKIDNPINYDNSYLFKNKLAIIIYTHSDYSDCWNPCFDSFNKFARNINIYLFVNNNYINNKYASTYQFPAHYNIIQYDDSLPYSQRFASCLDSVNEKHVILNHEDFFLYRNVNYSNLYEYINVLDKTDYSFIRLIKCGFVNEDSPAVIDKSIIEYHRLYEIDQKSNYIFAVQSTMWDKEKLFQLYNNNRYDRPAKMECPTVQRYCSTNDIKGLYCYHNLKKRGGCHWDSSDFPYMATGICAGKWNYTEYKKELDYIFQKYNIDMNIRGIR
jgi:hypothetical protein